MGNASGKEVENGPGGPSVRSDGGDPANYHLGGDMGISPPESPRQSRSPFMFAPQVFDLYLHLAAFFCFFDFCRSFLIVFGLLFSKCYVFFFSII